MATTCINFSNLNDEQKQILIALLSNIGYHGFEEKKSELNAFIEENVFDEFELMNIAGSLTVEYTRSDISDTNWNAEWESSFDPVTIYYPGSDKIFVNIRAAFHQPLPADYEIVITPKMSFGTGHHATTYGMIEQMSKWDFTNKNVIDFGTGTAVLAILSEKLGAANVLAIDNDDWSITNAKENIAANHCHNITLIKAQQFEYKQQPDFILANINLNVIKNNLHAICSACSNASIVMLSGMLVGDEEQITHELQLHDMKLIHVNKLNNWLIITCSKA